MSYRERCYNAFVSKHWSYYHSFSIEDYDLKSTVYSKRFRNVLPGDKKAAILDVACGAGYFLYFLKKEGYTNLKGIDISAEQLEMTRKMGIDGEKADLFEFLSNQQEKFDLIVAFDIIEHLTKDEVMKFLDSIHGALKPGGTVLVGTVNAASPTAVRTVFGDFTHETAFTPVSLAQVMRVCDFEVQVFAEKPVPHDLRSAFRSFLWGLYKKVAKFYYIVESGTGRGMYHNEIMLEPRMFARGVKPQ